MRHWIERNDKKNALNMVKLIDMLIYFLCMYVCMAKPIRATPTLRGEDARKFMRGVVEEQRNPSKARIELLQEAVQARFNLPQ